MEKLIYRHTDTERLEILRSFDGYLRENPVGEDSLFADYQINTIEENLSVFEKFRTYRECMRKQEEEFSNKYNQLFSKAKTFVVHYYMSMHMAIERGELPIDLPTWYGLQYPFIIPNPRNSEELLAEASHLFECDSNRVAHGGCHLSNPNISSVKIWIEKFDEINKERNYRQSLNKAEVENIDYIRDTTDKLIVEVFEAASERFADLEFEERLKRMNELGFNIQQIVRKPRVRKQEEIAARQKEAQLQIPLF
ncbi:MAG: hypothetical protein J6W06_10280 [Bacteroidales bacterium]|jgi:hypothetical protein|nr:hypothetical protein [Bacteroidales bacterium]